VSNRPERIKRALYTALWRKRVELAMLTPSIIILAVISIFPLLFMIYMSFMNFSAGTDHPTYFGIGNWLRILQDDVFWSSWGRTIYYTVGALGSEMVLGIAVALLIYSLPSVGRNLIITLWMLPIFVAPIVAGLLARFLFNSTYGLYAWLLQLIGVNKEILGGVSTAILAVIFVDVWEWTPLVTMIVLAGLQSMPQEPLEAALLDGAGYSQRLRYVVFPLISSPIIVALLIRSMDVLRFVDVIRISTAGGPANSTKIIGYHLLDVAFRFQNIGAAAAIGLTMLLATILLGKLFVRFMGRGSER
jgi:multiple sugar transport system permease protein